MYKTVNHDHRPRYSMRHGPVDHPDIAAKPGVCVTFRRVACVTVRDMRDQHGHVAALAFSRSPFDPNAIFSKLSGPGARKQATACSINTSVSILPWTLASRHLS